MRTILKLPHGAGTVTYDKRNSFNPYIARRYDCLDESGHPKYIYLGSFPNEIEAYLALKDASFKTKEELKARKYTFKQVYNILVKKEGNAVSFRKLEYAYRRSKHLDNQSYNSITSFQMQEIINESSSAHTQNNIKTLFCKMDKIASELDIIQKQRSMFLTTKKRTPKSIKYPFSNEEVYALLDRKDNPDVQLVLVLLYTGFRNGELRTIKKQNVNMDMQTIIGGFKTKAGTNRTIPIHPTILPIIESWMNSPGEYLLPYENGLILNYNKLVRIFKRAMRTIQTRVHTPHETRHTFRTRLDEQQADEICIDLLMGHQTPNPNDRIYCHKSIEQLRETIMKLW